MRKFGFFVVAVLAADTAGWMPPKRRFDSSEIVRNIEDKGELT